MHRRHPEQIWLTLFVLGLFLFPTGVAARAEQSTEFRLNQGRLPEESYLDLFFGSPPPIATERGIVVIDAFHDRDGNGRQDQGEEELRNQVTCKLDGVDYPVPAFIPGLDYEESYQLDCSGTDYQPTYSEQEIFIRNRGQVIEIMLPCRIKAANPKPKS